MGSKHLSFESNLWGSRLSCMRRGAHEALTLLDDQLSRWGSKLVQVLSRTYEVQDFVECEWSHWGSTPPRPYGVLASILSNETEPLGLQISK